MKYISTFFMAIAITVLVGLSSLSSCNSSQRSTSNPPLVTKVQSDRQPQTNSQTADLTVKIRNFKFEPANLAIAVGKTVRFINADEEPHTATATDGAFDSKTLDTDRGWNYTATKPGTYPYICAVHPYMKGTLTVTPQTH